MSEIEDIIKVVDARMGESKCQYVVQKLEFSYDSQISDLITQSTSVLCSGQLKNDRGTVCQLSPLFYWELFSLV